MIEVFCINLPLESFVVFGDLRRIRLSIVVKIADSPSALYHDELTAHEAAIFEVIEIIFIPFNAFIVTCVLLFFLEQSQVFALSIERVILSFKELPFALGVLIAIEPVGLINDRRLISLARAASPVSSELKSVIEAAH